MADYWKSTPNYWCKFCETFVRDTKIQRQQHEATGKHQGAIQRSLRNLGKDKEREDRETQRAKDEVARLTGIVSGKSAVAAPPSGTDKKPSAGQPAAPPRKATLQDAKANLAQLAAMGIAIPDAYRGEMAMAGEWQTVRQAPVANKIKPREGAEASGLNIGVRKRKVEEEDEEEEAAARNLSKRKAWGSAVKTVADLDQDNEDLDALFSVNSVKRDPSPSTVKAESGIKSEDAAIKAEPRDEDGIPIPPIATESETAKEEPVVKTEANEKAEDGIASTDMPGIVFKKRKNKGAKPK